MAQTDANVLVGAATVYYGDYVTNAGAATFTEFGHTSGPVEIAKEAEYYEPESEQSLGPVLSKIQKLSFTIKVPAMEATPKLLAILAEQDTTTQVTGTAPNQTVAIATPEVNYYQLKIVGTGPGTNATRTVTAWKCKVIAAEPIQFGRAAFQSYNMTFRVYRDSSITTTTTNGSYFKQVDT